MTRHHNGFTIVELIFISALLAIASVFFFIQKNNIGVTATDNSKKTAINAMYYSLEEVFYPANGFYPSSINSDNLKSVDPALFTDADGNLINTAGSAYAYKPTNCENDRCKGYTLVADLTDEADYIKTNRN